MKKLLTLSLAAVMALSMFVGCAAKTTSKVEETKTETKTEVKEETKEETKAEASDLADIKAAGVMNIGYTVYEPMNYEGEDGKLTGFDTEFAQAVCEKIGVEANFIIINWDTKIVELESKNIDCIWNGMTITDDLLENISVSNPYVQNKQVVVINTANADKYTDTASLAGATIVAEAGSAGELAITEDENLSQASYLPLAKQTDALLEVKTGSADAAIFDWTLAKSVIGEGTDFADLMMIDGVALSEENYGVGVRKDSDVKAAIDTAMKELVADGTLPALAEKYGLGLAE